MSFREKFVWTFLIQKREKIFDSSFREYVQNLILYRKIPFSKILWLSSFFKKLSNIFFFKYYGETLITLVTFGRNYFSLMFIWASDIYCVVIVIFCFLYIKKTGIETGKRCIHFKLIHDAAKCKIYHLKLYGTSVRGPMR